MSPGIVSLLERRIASWREYRRLHAAGAVGDFWRAGGNSLLWDHLPITASSVVIDAGGYRGDWCAETLWRFGCRVVVFEPIAEFAQALSTRFQHNARVTVVHAGLARESGSMTFAVAADGSSAFSGGGARVTSSVLDVAQAFAELGVDRVACMKINIEGGEYDVLERLLEVGLATRVSTFLIQFHLVADDSASRRERIRQALAKSHALAFDFPFVWERWDIRSHPPIG